MPLPEIIEINDPIIKEIGETADSLNLKIYVVGGYVRDYFLGKYGSDIDFTVIGDAIEFAKLIAQKYHTKEVIYERFRTALVPSGRYKLEFVGTRKEEYNKNSRKPTVSEGTLDDDLRRRDFTVNAMAISINSDTFGQFHDRFNGVKDLSSGILRTPLEAAITFSDDPLRMMRAARFAAKLNFTLEDSLAEAMKSMSERISIISQERISDEFLKTLAAPKPSAGLKILRESGLLSIVFPEIDRLSGVELRQIGRQEYSHKDVFMHTLQVLDNLAAASDNLWLRYAALTHDIAKPKTKRFVEGTGWTFYGHEELGARWQREIFRRMRFPLEHLPYVETLIRMHQRPMKLVEDGITDSAVRRLAVQAGDSLEDLFALCRADITTKNPDRARKYLRNYDVVFQKVLDVRERDNLREFQSPVRGEEIMALCNIPASRTVGFIKTAIEEAILDGIIPNDYAAAKQFLLDSMNLWLTEAESNPAIRTNRRAPK
ncbi:HD domain-containing protein [Ignavibacteria bacterium]|nr:HD domain-containing protein [Bacteroidota bacterium]MCZ2132786.1 CCA tRNA nucleotidyltransferase [Bacteroidota bacterium]